MEDATILEMKSVRKVFDKVVALDNVSFQLHRNEIHGLLGGNGAGKTTLMNILFGLYRMDSGEIILKDQKITIQSPKDAIQYGIGMVHQHFLQIGNFTVLENIVLGTKVKHGFTMQLAQEAAKVKELCQRFGLDVPLESKVEDLPMGSRQKVEILKAIYRGVQILILDEPTTNLTPQEVDALFESLRVMVNEGMSIVFITHKLREVMSVCDRISVLREGRNVVSLKRSEASEEVFVRGMVGDKMDIEKSVIFSGKRETQAVNSGQPVVLHMSNVNVSTPDKISRLKQITFSIQAGEIFGVAGVAGNGQRELAECVTSVHPPHSGQITFGDFQAHTKSTAHLFEHGLAYIPEDRLHDGFLPKANVAQNLILGFHHQAPYSKKGWINWPVVFTEVRKLIGEYNIKPPALKRLAVTCPVVTSSVSSSPAPSHTRPNYWLPTILHGGWISLRWILSTPNCSMAKKRAWPPCSSRKTWMNCSCYVTASPSSTVEKSWISSRAISSRNTPSAA